RAGRSYTAQWSYWANAAKGRKTSEAIARHIRHPLGVTMRAARCGVKIGSSPPLGPQRRQSRGGAANKKKGSSRKGAKLAEQTKSFNRRAVSATGRHEMLRL